MAYSVEKILPVAWLNNKLLPLWCPDRDSYDKVLYALTGEAKYAILLKNYFQITSNFRDSRQVKLDIPQSGQFKMYSCIKVYKRVWKLVVIFENSIAILFFLSDNDNFLNQAVFFSSFRFVFFSSMIDDDEFRNILRLYRIFEG